MGKRMTVVLEGHLTMEEVGYQTSQFEFFVGRERLKPIMELLENQRVRITVEQLPDSDNNGD